MEKHAHTIKKSLFALVLLVLLLPFIQQHVRFWESEPLEGFQTPAEKRWFSVEGWWSGIYQEDYNKWHNENFGFRPELVRVYNQIAFSIYNEAKSNGTVIGKDGYLYELNYIRALTGEDYVGYEKLNTMATKLKEMQDSMAARGKTLIVCFAPGKASFYPEYIPEEYGKEADTTNNKVFAQLLQQKNVNLIDYNKWFMEMKGKTPHLLYPKTGVHWSRYGSTLAIDSLIKYVEQKQRVDMPSMIWDRILTSDSLRSPDDDIARALNLFWPPKGLTMGYPEYHFEDTAGKAKLKLMTFGDSFFWSMFDIALAPRTFSEVCFYYYNAQIFRSDHSPMVVADIETCMKDADEADVIMLIATECTVWNIGWGFIDEGHDHFVGHKMVESMVKLIQRYENAIRADEKWMNDVRKKADAQGKTLDEMIYLDARFLAEQEMAAAEK